MCCFSGKVDNVSQTRIFARSKDEGRQLLVYSMKLTASIEVAMVLPLPVPAGTAEDAVKFIDMKDYPDFFTELLEGYPVVKSEDKAAPAADAPLAVVEVGDFVASFVPTVADFSRLDAQFRLPDGTFEKLPGYRTWGFAVFQLKPNTKLRHPMAFTFPRADPGRLFFPTVHIHDGEIHPRAKFEHGLYCQAMEGEAFDLKAWRETPDIASKFVTMDKAKDLIAGDRHIYREWIYGERDNQDIYL